MHLGFLLFLFGLFTLAVIAWDYKNYPEDEEYHDGEV